MWSSGSSPLARGLLAPHEIRSDGARIIPARAGFTILRLPEGALSMDHPRSRGVYIRSQFPHQSHQGSSPLARGLQAIMRPEWVRAGIIPARAGFTVRWPCGWWSRRDHPRSRGVYHTRTPTALRSSGSSPLARGLPGAAPTRVVVPGIIPARAGFTRRPRGRLPAHGDHPRSRGVYWSVDDQDGVHSGSSPLARGLPQGSTFFRGSGWIIPARAGFTPTHYHHHITTADHPRSRGVYDDGFIIPAGRRGSSPLARGLRITGARHHIPNRIIPARAGFTDQADSSLMLFEDHPRSRGVYLGNGAVFDGFPGSSPLARGLPGEWQQGR